MYPNNVRIYGKRDTEINMTFKKFDIIMFSILAILSEFLANFLFDVFNSGFILSFSLLIFLIASLRWGVVGIVPFLLSSIPSIALEHNMELWQSIIYYFVANAFAIIPTCFYAFACKNKSRNKIIKSPLYLILFSLASFLSLALGKWIAIIVINHDVEAILSYFSSMILTYCLTLIVLYALSRLRNSVVVDMDSYVNE